MMGIRLRVGLIGPQRVGKTTAAEYLTLVYGAREYPLAAPIYDIATRLYGMQGKDRALLVGIGEALRSVDTLVFCKNTLREIITDDPDIAVVSDIRLPQEVEFFQEAGFDLIRIHAPLELRANRPGFDWGFVRSPTEEIPLIGPWNIVTNDVALEGDDGFYDRLSGEIRNLINRNATKERGIELYDGFSS